MIHTITYAAHIAHLDPMTGNGMLVLPRPCDDLTFGRLPSLHQSAWDHVMRALDALGWEPSEDETGDLIRDAYTADGREVIGLYGREPIHSDASVAECAAISAELLRLAGITSDDVERAQP